MRKGQYGYGWDWGPRLPTIGIWRPVELRRERVAALTRVSFATLADRAPMRSCRSTSRPSASPATASSPRASSCCGESATVRGPRHRLPPPRRSAACGGRTTSASPRCTSCASRCSTTASRSTRASAGSASARSSSTSGPTPTSRARASSASCSTASGSSPAARTGSPPTRSSARSSGERYERLIEDAVLANMNMLRVWGGGIYEHDVFYDECDRRGVLVWQDFMFSCATYPEEALAEEVELEARAQVSRLGGHPCLALWCGNNENQWIHDMQFPERGGARVPGALFYDEILPRTVAELDPHTPYWPGSPFGGNDHNAREEGDVHNWEVWHGQSRAALRRAGAATARRRRASPSPATRRTRGASSPSSACSPRRTARRCGAGSPPTSSRTTARRWTTTRRTTRRTRSTCCSSRSPASPATWTSSSTSR